MKMPAAPLILLLCAPLGPATSAQDEPPLIEEPPLVETPQEGAPAEEPPKGPRGPLPPAEPPEAPRTPLSTRLDFQRWQEMTPRERQVFVEGAVSGMAAAVDRLRQEIATDRRATPDRQQSVTRFIKEHAPRRAASIYLREMYNIYLTQDGRDLTMIDCFLRAYQRLNVQ
jgi:hypothetical protein